MIKFATVRLGKTSVDDIKRINSLPSGILSSPIIVPVICTQVPLELETNTIIFLWFGSDNAKGMPTEWKQGFKAVGTVVEIIRGASFNSETTTKIRIEYVFSEAINRLDILRDASSAYFNCANLPIIGIDDHSNQTIRIIDEKQDLSDSHAFLYALNKVHDTFKTDICQIHPELTEYFYYYDKRIEKYVGLNVRQSISETSYLPYLTALRTKPFMLLAGISGTGKSRIVRELAFKSCPEFLQDQDGTTPGNYCMIEVKPNWHDSSELLGYYSSIAKQYIYTDFVKFLVKAMMFPEVPFFVCLDEMNLAPVEQYFAEFLSVLETRKKTESGIKTGALVKAKYFENLPDADRGDGYIYTQWFPDIKQNVPYNIYTNPTLKTKGLGLPENVFVIGTVNMDDTTHQFSRKVLDRAMTIEMNGGKLTDMFGHSNDLEYLPEENVWKIDQFKPKHVNADEVLEEHIDSNGDLDETGIALKTQLADKLDAINQVLKDTPFVVSYRVLNELVIYAGVLLDDGKGMDEAINDAVDQITLMKILPRIEGDEDMLGNAKDDNNRLCRLMKVVGPQSQAKLKEMNRRLESGFTRFWP